MSVYIPKDSEGRPKSPYWQYDFRIKVKGQGSQRFYGSTGQEGKQAAQRVEKQLKERAALGQLSCHMTISQACWRYWNETGETQRSAKDNATILEALSTYFGPDKLLTEITPDDISAAAAARARTPVKRNRRIGRELVMSPTDKMPSTSTVNRQIIEPIKRLLNCARRRWGIPIDLDQFDWRALSYAEAAERTRELFPEEEDRLWRCLRVDYHPIMEMYIISGRRLSDWINLKKSHVDRTAGTIRFPTRKRKEQGEITVMLTARELEIICEEWDKAPFCEYVFTYEAVHPVKGRGSRHRITVAGFRKVTDQAFKAAKLENFRRHDLRHTFASRFRRQGGDIRALQSAMDHQHSSSTMRYAHVTAPEVVEMKSRVKVNLPSRQVSTGDVVAFPKGKVGI